ncbi:MULTISPECIES: zinc metalloprotease HtpX [Candidatus Neomicrothrix]|jgi:heat shock protein HtpX|nr:MULTISPECIES: zinc metalloprotease HtpX [Microthrix]HBX08433.1 protease HtpX [Candidatus Microthrix parvicella]MBK6503506.1 zinc metalloprotease HtpX [Candidatus Microthrix sp.]MBK7020678.1 zinc metalloprotease HtpX [Candidatus Microthrix sp.]MBK7323808.1 zinc metalloprotease HtpX [Candidatus Microthrix sp.]MBL0204496.1 zinc metalloprotease HtpX [Candidatus Microthrix sp.]
MNNVKTAALLAGMAGLVMAIGSFWGQSGLIMAFGFSVVMIGGSYWFSDRLAIASARAKPVGPDELPEFHRVMAELTAAANLPMPGLFVSPDPQPNAFATGRNPHHAAVCVTQGLLQALTWDEIRGVLAHELSHVRNRDILTSSVAAAIASTITFAARMAMWGAIFGGGGSGGRDRNGGGLEQLALIVLGPIAAAVIQMAISRNREFAADASAARLLGTGEPLAQALDKLDLYSHRIPSNVNPAQSQAYIVNPLRGGGMQKLFSTHPPVDERISRLRNGTWV